MDLAKAISIKFNFREKTSRPSSFEKSIEIKPLQIPTSTRATNKFLKKFGIPEPTRSLLWVTSEDVSKIRTPGQYVIEIRSTPKEKDEKDKYNFYSEPSLIWARLPIKKNNALENGALYCPAYSTLTPEQRWQYLCWLRNVEEETNLSYVFLYYYGLERHLLLGDYDKAVDEILRLLKHHRKKSFPDYAIAALITASAHRKRLDIIEKAPMLLDEITNEALYLRALAGKRLLAKDIMNLFYLKKLDRNHYIIKCVESHPEMFMKKLKETIEEYETQNGQILEKLNAISAPKRKGISFANTSFSHAIRTINVPNILFNKEFQSIIRKLLSRTYSKVKGITKG